MTAHLRPYVRQEKRSTVRLFGQLKYMKSSIHCRVIDLSEKGLGLQMSEPRPLTAGMSVEFHGPELGHLTGTIAWVRNGTVGLKLNHTSSTYAQVKSYFRFFHRDLTPVLRD